MGFSTNYENTKDNDLLPVGEYEVIFKSAEERTAKSGKVGINFVLTIRNDVGQKYGNRCIFYSIWKRKEPSQADMQVQGYSFNQLMFLAKTVGLPSGTAYETVLDLCKDFCGKAIRVKVIHDDWNGKTREVVDTIDKTNFPNISHKWKEKKQTAVPPSTVSDIPDDFEEIISDDDVPF